VDNLKLKRFQKFENAVSALNEAAALTDGKVSPMLANLLEELKDETKASCTQFCTRGPHLGVSWLICCSGCR
jgi:hypothetical protein